MCWHPPEMYKLHPASCGLSMYDSGASEWMSLWKNPRKNFPWKTNWGLLEHLHFKVRAKLDVSCANHLIRSTENLFFPSRFVRCCPFLPRVNWEQFHIVEQTLLHFFWLFKENKRKTLHLCSLNWGIKDFCEKTTDFTTERNYLCCSARKKLPLLSIILTGLTGFCSHCEVRSFVFELYGINRL